MKIFLPPPLKRLRPRIGWVFIYNNSMKNSKWSKLVKKEDILKAKDQEDFIFSIINLSKHFNIPSRRMSELVRYYEIEIERLTKWEKITTEGWIKDCIKIHGNTYDYSKSVYVNSSTSIIIICKVHGEIKVCPNRHKNGSKCRRCSAKETSIFKKSCLEDFKVSSSTIHNGKYDYSLIKSFETLHDKVKIICPDHGIFEQKMYSHKYGAGCEKCSYVDRGIKGRVTLEEWKTRVSSKYNDYFNYDKSHFEVISEIVTIGCPLHGDFQQVAKDHDNGGCMECSKLGAKYAYEKDYSFIEEAKRMRSGVYILEFKDFYKIGISSNIRNRINCIKSRLKLDYSPKILFNKKCSLFDAVNTEKRLHKKCSQYQFTYPTYFEGQTECFNSDLPIEKIIKDLKNLPFPLPKSN